MIFTFIHVAVRIDNGNVDGIYIYDVLDYDQDNGAYALILIIIFIGTPILYFLTWLIYWLGRTTAQHIIGKASLGGEASSGGEAALQHTMALVWAIHYMMGGNGCVCVYVWMMGGTVHIRIVRTPLLQIRVYDTRCYYTAHTSIYTCYQTTRIYNNTIDVLMQRAYMHILYMQHSIYVLVY